MSNQIPDSSRVAVRSRAHDRCERCRVPTPRGDWHHRRPRAVRDLHTHCACNGVYLCRTCHTWVHAHPVEARAQGWIVSRYRDDPYRVVVTTAWGVRWHTCNGGITYPQEQP